MIKKEIQLVPIPRWKRSFKAGEWITNKQSGQFGTIRPEDLRGKYARRNLSHNINWITFYLVDRACNDYKASSEVLFTYQDGSIIRGVADSMPRDQNLVSIDVILMSQAQLMDCWVTLGTNNPLSRFRHLAPHTVGEIVKRGGSLYLEMETVPKYDAGFIQSMGITDPKETQATLLIPKLHEGKFIIHLTP